MGFARVPLWDKHYALLGFKLGSVDGLDAALGVRCSLWSCMDQLGLSALRQIKGASTSFFAWELSDALWSQAQEMSQRHPDSFGPWCSRLRELQIALVSPPCAAALGQLDPSLALARALASRGVPLWNAAFSLDPARIALSSASSGVVVDAGALGLHLCSVLGSKFAGAGKAACSERVDDAASARSLSDSLPSAMMSGLALWAPPPLPAAPRRFDPSAARLLAALALAFADADLGQLEEAIKSDAALAFKFIALLNTAAHGPAGLRGPGVGSVRQGIVALGRQRLTQWLSLLLLRIGQRHPHQTALRWSISARARLCENIARLSRDPHPAPEAFVCGMLSGLPTALGVAPAQFFSQCPLPPPLRAAVQRREGPLGEILSLAIQCESPSGLDGASQPAVARLALDGTSLNESRREAFQWAWSTL